MMSELSFVDLFCGAGGAALGLKNAGIAHAVGLDNDKLALQTYKRHIGHTSWCDVLEMSEDQIRTLKNVGHPDKLLWMSPPCQSFSAFCAFNRYIKPEHIADQFIHKWVETLEPRYVAVENVPRYRKEDGRVIVETLTKLGYHVSDSTVYSWWYGVPQYRRRWIVIASRDSTVGIPSATHFDSSLMLGEKQQTVRDAIADLPPLELGQSSDVDHHNAATLKGYTSEIVKKLKPGEVSPSGVWTRAYSRLWWDRPSPAVTTKFNRVGNGRTIHPGQDRPLTVRECARLQGFPDY